MKKLIMYYIRVAVKISELYWGCCPNIALHICFTIGIQSKYDKTHLNHIREEDKYCAKYLYLWYECGVPGVPLLSREAHRIYSQGFLQLYLGVRRIIENEKTTTLSMVGLLLPPNYFINNELSHNNDINNQGRKNAWIFQFYVINLPRRYSRGNW